MSDRFRLTDNYLIHSAKGTHWTKDNHKYVRKDGNKYVYKSDESGSESKSTENAKKVLTAVISSYNGPVTGLIKTVLEASKQISEFSKQDYEEKPKIRKSDPVNKQY